MESQQEPKPTPVNSERMISFLQEILRLAERGEMVAFAGVVSTRSLTGSFTFAMEDDLTSAVALASLGALELAKAPFGTLIPKLAERALAEAQSAKAP